MGKLSDLFCRCAELASEHEVREARKDEPERHVPKKRNDNLPITSIIKTISSPVPFLPSQYLLLSSHNSKKTSLAPDNDKPYQGNNARRNILFAP